MSSLLDEVLDRVDILDIVTQYVKLRKAGKNYLGLCPFHKEKTPSFTVSTEKQIFYCFGCHEG
ncbi:MAG TPA: DNA primase, partial [Deltaproteobacteria bacterium]|nr:DNA primase [Deltaproteobacteria bacterium]